MLPFIIYHGPILLKSSLEQDSNAVFEFVRHAAPRKYNFYSLKAKE